MGCEIDAKGCTSQQYEGISSPDIQPVVPPEWLRSLWSSVKQLETGCLALQEVIESSIIDDQPNAPGEGGRRVNHLEVSLPLQHWLKADTGIPEILVRACTGGARDRCSGICGPVASPRKIRGDPL